MLKKLKQWNKGLNEGPPPKRILVLVLSLLVIFLLWYVIVQRSISSMKASWRAKRTQAEKQVKALTSEILQLSEEAEPQKESLKSLQAEIEKANKELLIFQDEMVPAKEVLSVLRKVLSTEGSIYLEKLQTLTPKPLGENMFTAEDVGSKVQYEEHGIEIVLKGDYSSVFKFLTDIERLKWRFFWEGLNYQVMKYPEARVVIRLHTLSRKS